MKQGKRMLFVSAWVAAMAGFALPPNDALACTRVLYVGDQNMVATGRNMDWNEDMMSNLWIFPRGMRRKGLAGPNSLDWESRYGSVIVSGYEAGSTDGMNEKGFVANLLFLAESDYGKPQKGEKVLSLSLWLQYFLDNYASVDEAVRAQQQSPLRLVPSKPIPGGKESKVHLSISDATGDSAIFEYIDGKLVIYHSRDYKVMTNSPVYSEQLAINAYWEDVGGTAFLPGANRSADRFARASFFLNAVPTKLRLSGCCRSHEHQPGRQHSAGHYHARQAQHRFHDLAYCFRSEEPGLLLRFGNTPQYVLGRFQQARFQQKHPCEKADGTKWRGLFWGSVGLFQGVETA